MKNLLFILLLLSLIISCNSNKKEIVENDHFYMPAEYNATHEFVWLGWEDYAPYHQPLSDLTKTLLNHVSVRMIAYDSLALSDAKSTLTKNGIDINSIQFFIMKDNRIWMRDHGATYVINNNGDKKAVNFSWSLYGFKEYLEVLHEGNIDSVNYHLPRRLGQRGVVDSIMGTIDNFASIKTDVVMEGGSIEVNGKGTLILNEVLTLQRNPKMSKEYLESEFERTLGTSNIIWLKDGLIEDTHFFNNIFDDYYGWGVGGHTDEFVRFVNDSTILLSWVDEAEKNLNEFNRINYERMSENLKILENARDQEGKPFTIIKVPAPDLFYKKVKIVEQEKSDWSNGENWDVPVSWLPRKGIKKVGDTINRVAAASYFNYLVTNDIVILPTYTKHGSSPEKEERVKEIFTKAFPNRKLVFLDVINLNYLGGGIHCVTQQQPKN